MTKQGDGDLTVRRADIPSLDGLRAVSIVPVLAEQPIRDGSHSFRFRALFLHADLGVRVVEEALAIARDRAIPTGSVFIKDLIHEGHRM